MRPSESTGFRRFSRGDLLYGLVLGDGIRRQDAAPVGAGINDRAAPDDAAGVQDGIAADVRVIAQQRAELAQPGVPPLTPPCRTVTLPGINLTLEIFTPRRGAPCSRGWNRPRN